MKRVLVTPLDWGLGHATRCIPIINLLMKAGNEVILGGTGQSLTLLKYEFPELKAVELPGYHPVYPASGSMMFTLALQAGKFVRVVRQENTLVRKIIQRDKIDIIISDNRYGCYSKEIPSVIITHQVTLPSSPGWKWLAWLANHVTGMYINKFTTCWVPDYPGSVLSGKLSATTDHHIKFIGPLSRFHGREEGKEFRYDILALISGPEPQRSIFEECITKQIVGSGLKALIIRGVVDTNQRSLSDTVEVIDHLKADKLEEVIRCSKVVIARSGYSTIMDLVKLKKKAIFIPTPGQTEQEYLAHRFMQLGVAWSMDQKSFSLQQALKESVAYSGFKKFTFDEELLQTNLSYLLKT
jgi:uncharacterized protein (TIGR00661 family)